MSSHMMSEYPTDRTKDEESHGDHSSSHSEQHHDYENATASLLNDDVFPRLIHHTKHAIALRVAKDVVLFLIPSWIRSSNSTTQSHVPQKVHKTLWLDGLRGIASVLVMFHHTRLLWYGELGRGYASCATCYHIIQLPFLRLLYSGAPMVAIFFVVSGFSLSFKALSVIRTSQPEKAFDALSSSVFRRGIRLLLPPIVLTFFMMLFTYFGWYPIGDGSRQPPHRPTLLGNIGQWLSSSLEMMDVFRPSFTRGTSYAVYMPPYDPNLWTIDVEFQGSIVVFCTLLGVVRLRDGWRLFVLGMIPLWLLWNAHSYLFLFLSGVLLAELHLRRENRSSPVPLSPHTLDAEDEQKPGHRPSMLVSEKAQNGLWTLFWVFNFALALYILGIPLLHMGAAETPGYIFLATHIPSNYANTVYIKDTFWLYIAAVHLVFTIDRAPFLQSIFVTRIARYLGKIGFALYLVHGTMLYTVGYRLTNVIGEGKWGEGAVLRALIVWALAFWAADVVWRGVDEKSVRLAGWVYGKVTREQR